MTILENAPLASLSTFRTGGPARFFCAASKREELKEALDFAQEKGLPVFILGGGSNVLVSDKGFDGLVVKMEMKGIEELVNDNGNAPGRAEVFFASAGGRSKKELVPDRKGRRPGDQNQGPEGQDSRSRGEGRMEGNQDFIFIRAGAGEEWDAFVKWTVEKGYGGLENLSLIPGTVGAAPVQNVGAYGAEVKSLIHEVEAFDLLDGSFRTFSNEDCKFSYRDSMFKHEKGRYAIVSVLFKLRRDAGSNISYKDLQEYFKAQGSRLNDQGRPSIAEVRDAVVAIRTAKLPDVSKVGTAGSFFKNPVVSREKFESLKKEYPELPGFSEPDGRIKAPLAWIIDKACGLKGKRFGNAGIHDAQALVIVNHGGATSDDVEKVAKEIEKAVKEKTGIEIEREVVMV